MTEIKFTVAAVPVSQPRPRAVRMGNAARVHELTHIGTGENRKPHPIVAYKATVRMAAESAYQGPPLEGPLWMSLVFVMPRPKTMVWKSKPMPRIPDTRKPDRDNLMKSTQDAINGLLWRDDSQIYSGPTTKWIASGEEQPHVEVWIREL